MKKIFTLCFLMALVCVKGWGQTVLISPTGDGGFETGTTFAANGWTVDNNTSTTRVWQVGTGQTGYTGSRAAFIGDNSTTVGATTSSRTVHLYRSISIPAGATNIVLTFKYKQATADYSSPTFYDYLRVYVQAAAPTSGSLPTATNSVFGPYPTTSITTFTSQSVTLSNTLAGTTNNLIFTFNADGVTPHGYGAVDDISLTYTPSTTPLITTSTTSLSAFTQTIGSPSVQQFYNVSGSNLTNPIIITPPSNFQISTTNGSGYSSSAITLAPASGTIASTPIYVVMNASTAGTYSGNVVNASSGATTVNVAVNGTAQNACIAPSPANTPNISLSTTAPSTSVVVGYNAPSTAPSGYLIVRYAGASPTVTAPTNGTSYPSGSLGAGTVVYNGTLTSYTNTGLTANTAYTYYIYTYNNTTCNGGPTYNTSPISGSIITCVAAPTSSAATLITSSGFTANWSASTSATSYLLDVSTNSSFTTFVTGYNGLNVGNVTSYAVTSLSASTPYFYRVRAVGAAGCSSANSVIQTAITACASTSIPYVQGFNSTAIPSCWSTSIVATQTATKISFVSSGSNPTTSPYEGADMVYYNSYFSSGGGSGSEERLISAPLSTTSVSSVDVQFQWRNENNTSYNSGTYLLEGVQVQYSLNGTTWTDVSNGFFTRHDATLAAGTAQWNQKTVTLPSVAGNVSTVYIAFKFHSSFGDNMYMDAVDIHSSPTCIAPTLGTITSITSSSASVPFTCTNCSPGNAYIVEYGPAGFTPGTAATAGTNGTAIAASLSPVPLSGLSANTTYDVYIRQNCGSGSYSVNSTKATFTTALANCTAPTTIAASITLTVTGKNIISGNFTAAPSPVPTGYVVVRSTSSATPVLTSGTTYALGASTVATNGYIEYSGTIAGSWTSTGLVAGATYYYFVFSYNNTTCANGPVYSTTATTANATTTSCITFSSVISIGGTTTIAGSVYPTLTAALADLTSCGISQPTKLELKSNYSSASESFPIIISPIPGASVTNRLTIKPAAGVVTSITSPSTAASDAVIVIDGADYITIDGSNTTNGTDRSLTLSNPYSGDYSVLWIASDYSTTDAATNNIVKNCVVTGSGATTTTVGIYSGSDYDYSYSADAPNSNNTIQNNLITKVGEGIVVFGYSYTTGTYDQNWVIDGNSIGSTNASDKLAYDGILVEYINNYTISSNTITGVELSSFTDIMTGISLNVIATNGKIFSNKISDIKNLYTTNYYSQAIGIYISQTSTSANTSIYNNFISDITAYGSAGTGTGSGSIEYNNGYGIYLYSGGGYNIDYNTISLSTNQTRTASISSCIFISSNYPTTANTINLRNNIFSNTETVGTAYSIDVNNGSNAMFATIDNNDYWSNNNIGFLTSVRTSLAAWKTATTKDANSLNIQPAFVSATDLHLASTSSNFCLAAGTSISTITTDIDAQTRTVPFIGADEITYTLSSIGVSSASCINSSATVSVTTPAGTLATGTYTVTFTLSGANTSTGSTATMNYTYTAGTTNSGTFNVAAALLPNAGNTNITITKIQPVSACSNIVTAVPITGTNNTAVITVSAPPTVSAPTISPSGTIYTSTNNAAAISVSTTNATSYLWQYYNGSAWQDVAANVPPGFTYTNTTTATLGINTGSQAGDYKYHVIVSNGSCSTTSSDVTLTVTAALPPTVITLPVSNVTTTGATLGVNVTNSNGSTIIVKGVYYGTNSGSTDNQTVRTGNTTGTYSTNVSDLSVNTKYYYSGYAASNAGAGTGSEFSFYTLALAPSTPTVGIPLSTSVPVTENPNSGNPAYTTYSIRFTTGSTSLYVQANGAVGTTEVFRTAAAWSTITVSGLTPATTYSVDSRGQNGDGTSTGVPTAWSSAALVTTLNALGGTVTVVNVTCNSGSDGSVTVSATGGSGNYRYKLNSGTPQVSNVFSGLSAGTYTITITDVSDVSATPKVINNITVSQPAAVVPTFTAAPTSSVCIGSPVTYTTQAGQTNYSWTFTGTAGSDYTVTYNNGSSSTSNTTIVTWLTSGSKTVTVNYSTPAGCTGASSASSTVTVNPNAVAGTISGTTPLCSGTTATYTSSGNAGGVWTSSNTGVATINASTGVVTAVTAGTTNITYTVTGCNAPAPASKTLTVSQTPVASIETQPYAACDGFAPGITFSGTANATITYTIAIQGGGSIATTPITIDAIGSTVTKPAPAGAGIYTYTIISVSIGNGCTGTITNATTTVTINPLPIVSDISGSDYIAVGKMQSYSSTSTTPGGTWTISNTAYADFASGYTSTSNPVVLQGLSVGTFTLSYTVTGTGGCSTTVTKTVQVFDNTIASYRTKQDGYATNPDTWSILNDNNVWVDANAYPGNDDNIEVRHNLLLLYANYDGNAGTSFTITDHDTTIGGVTTNLKGSLTIAPTHFFQSKGGVNFNSRSVTLQSSTDGTAAIGIMTTPIANATNVQVERFTDGKPSEDATGSRRAWRLITSPVTGQTIHEAWQENATLTNTNPNPGYGTLITGEGLAGASAADLQGYDYIGGGNHTSIRHYSASLNNWVPLSNDGTTTGTKISLQNEQAYMLFIRGNRAIGTSGSSSAILRSTGTLQQGQRRIGLPTSGTYFLLGNPYASAIDFSKFIAHNGNQINDEFYSWNSTIGAYGSYVLVTHTGTGPNNAGGYSATPVPLIPPGTQNEDDYKYIPNGSGFFVEPKSGATGDITFEEDDKAPGKVPTISPFREIDLKNVKELLVNLNLKDSDTSASLADGFRAKFSDDYAGSEEENSNEKAWNFNENLNLVRNSKYHIIEARKDVQKTDTLFVQMWNVTKRAYQLQMRADNFSSAISTQAWLVDSYLGTKQPISLSGSVVSFDFAVNSDSNSAKTNRFMIVFQNNAVVLPITLTNVKAAPQNGGVNISWTVTNEVNVKGYTIEKSTNGGQTYTAVGTQQPARNNAGAALTSYNGFDAQPKLGDNLYRIRIEAKDGSVTYSTVVKVTIESNGSGIEITVYPNPVRDGKVNMQMTNLAAGTYLVGVYASGSGQALYQRKVFISLPNTTQSEQLILGKGIAQGSYQLRVSDHKGVIIKETQLVIGR